MKCTADYKNYLRGEIGKLKGLIDQGVIVTSKGVEIKPLLDKFMSAYSLVSKGQDPTALLEEFSRKEENLLYVAARRELKTTFKGGFGKEANKEFVLEDFQYDGGDKFKVLVRPVVEGKVSERRYGYTFKRGTDRSLVVRKGSQLYIPNIHIVAEKAIRRRDEVLFDVNKDEYLETGNKELERLKRSLEIGSTKNKMNFAHSKKRSEYLHGDVDQMKRLVEELNVLDEGQAKDSYVEYVQRLFDKMHSHFFYDMDLYVKKGKTAGGWVDVNNKRILIQTRKDQSGDKSNAEVYAHEVIHTMTHWALHNEDSTRVAQIKRELNYAMRVAKDSIRWQDYLDKDESKASELEKSKAKEIYEYIFSSEYADDEFLAHALTNPKTIELLGKVKLKREEDKAGSLFGKFTEIFHTIVDILLGNFNFSSRNKTVQEQVHALAFRLAEINKDAEEKKNRLNLWGRLNNLIDQGEEGFYEKAVEFQEKYFDKEDKIKVPQGDSKLEQLKFFGEVVMKSFINKRYRNLLGLQMTMWSKVGIPLKSGGTVREFMSSFFSPDEAGRATEMYSLQNEHIDTLRNTVIQQTYKSLREGFSKPISKKMGKALTRAVLETNMSSLVYADKNAAMKRVYSNKDLREVLTDEKVRNLRRKQAEDKLKQHLEVLSQAHRFNWVRNQSRGLGYFMATHKGNVAQNSSALNIVKGALSRERHKVDANTLALVQEISVLTAIQYTDKADTKLAAEIMADEWKGTMKLMDTYEAFKRDSKEKLFEKDEAHMMDGYTKELFDDTVELVHKPMSEKGEMEKAGYTFVGELKPKAGEIRKKRIGMFVSEAYSRGERFRGAVNLGGLVNRGTDLKEIKYMEDEELALFYFERDMARMNKEAVRLQKDMYLKEDIDFSSFETGVMPLVNAQGKVVNYRYMMDKKQKESLLGQELNPLEVMARSMGSVVDKELREEHNNKVLALVRGIMQNQWKGAGVVDGNGVEYTLIGPKVNNAEMRELYNMLPRSFQKFIKSRKDKTMAIPSDLMPLMFGYRHMKMTDRVKTVLPKSLVKVLDMFEALWVDMIKIAKGNILLKMPIILVSNIVSNALYLFTVSGMGPVELVKAHAESMKSAKAYLEAYRNVNRLTVEIGQLKSALNSSAKDKTGIKEEITQKEWKIKRLRKEMEENSIHELFENGLFQSVVEDVEVGVLKDGNAISDKIDEMMDKTPVFVQKVGQWAYLSKETAWYKFNQEVLQLSDLVARDIMNKKMKYTERQIADGKKAMPKELRDRLGIKGDKPVKLTGAQREKFFELSKKGRIAELLDSFINYNKPNGRFEEYLNRIGLLMFTKYVKRIQKVIATTAIRHPIRSFVTLLLAVFAIDVDNIQDQAFLTKGFGHDGEFGFDNIFPIYSPMENIMNVITPPLVKLAV